MKKLLFSLAALYSFTITSQLPQPDVFLDKNRVRAMINKTNDKFWKPQNVQTYYEVPKGSGKNGNYTNGLWIAGLDAAGTLHMSVNVISPNLTDYFAGPLDTTNISSFTPSISAKYAKVWKNDCEEIYKFVSAYNSGSVTLNTFNTPAAIKNYPAIQQGPYMKPMENFKDINNNGIYDPLTEGDYPLIKGHQQVMSIYNDQLGTHGESGAPPMGLEIHEKAYAFYDPNLHDTMKVVNFTTYYEFTVYNRTEKDYLDVYITDWSDTDVGGFADDFMGTDTVNRFVYCYNSNTPDTTTAYSIGYGNQQPVLSHALMDCITCAQDGIDNNNNNQVDEPNENFEMNVTFNSHPLFPFPAGASFPANKEQFYNYMRGYWQDSSHLKYGGTGYNPSSNLNSNWIYTGNPATGTGWTEAAAGNVAGDRATHMTSGPFYLPAKKSFVYSYAIVFSQDSINPVNTITQFNTRVQRDVRNARYYAKTHQSPQCAPAIIQPTIAGISSVNREMIKLYPNPAGETLNISLDRNYDGTLQVRDISGRLVLEQNVSGKACEADLKNLSPGIYLIQVKDTHHRIECLFIKMNN